LAARYRIDPASSGWLRNQAGQFDDHLINSRANNIRPADADFAA
jgi:hypothetical protein